MTSRLLLGTVAASLVLGFLGLGPGDAARSTAGSPVIGQPGAPGSDSELFDGSDPGEVADLGGEAGDTARRTRQSGGVDTSALECAPGRNGDRTDTGVSADKIRLAATVVKDGPASSLLKESPTAMQAVVNRVNSQGGICGRVLELTTVNDSFRSDTGQQFIQNFINDPTGYFALPVVPSAEGLGAAILAGDIRRAKIPVVGTDGMRAEQYEDPFVWPVATATVSTMRIIADYAFKVKGARTFAIVWDSKYRFGIEGADAFKEQVKAMGGDLVADQRLDPTAPAYASEARAFNERCANDACDAVVMLLLPDAALKWMDRQPALGKVYTAGAQTLFSDDFAQRCASNEGTRCHGIAAWTGYNPPVDRYVAVPEVARYRDDLRAISPKTDVRNQFTQGAYLGMSLFAEAAKRVGPNLTRERLRTTLDAMDYNNGMTAGLSWRPDNRFANVRARAFSIVVSDSGQFLDWRDEQTDWVIDPRHAR